MLIVGQKLRPKMLFLATRLVNESHRRGFSPLRRYLHDAQVGLAENYDAAPVPGDPADINGCADFFYGPSRNLNSFKLARSWENQVAAVRGPGNAIRQLRSVEPPRRRSVQRPQPYSGSVLGFGDEGECSSI